MSVLSSTPTSRRGYLSQTELAQLANISITDSTEADDQISQAEELIDQFVGPQDKFLEYEIVGKPTAVGALSLTLQSDQQNVYDVNYFKLCEIEIVGGTGEGQRRKITASTKEGVLTIDLTWATSPTTSSFYRIYQLGKFPRHCDVELYSNQAPTTYLKRIPEAIKRAVAAQVQYVIEKGESFMSGDGADKISESIGDYSYTNAPSSATVYKLISPKVRLMLKGIINRTGQIIA